MQGKSDFIRGYCGEFELTELELVRFYYTVLYLIENSFLLRVYSKEGKNFLKQLRYLETTVFGRSKSTHSSVSTTTATTMRIQLFFSTKNEDGGLLCTCNKTKRKKKKTS